MLLLFYLLIFTVGITSQLWYLQHIGVNALYMNPIYESPMLDFGYDITNHTRIDPIFGTMDDFDLLLNEVHHLGNFTRRNNCRYMTSLNL